MSLISPSSRYRDVGTQLHVDAQGREVTMLRRRFLPAADSLAEIGNHKVAEDERDDHIAFQRLGDPELFWQLADANDVFWPRELERPGRILRITLPAGTPGPPR